MKRVTGVSELCALAFSVAALVAVVAVAAVDVIVAGVMVLLTTLLWLWVAKLNSTMQIIRMHI